MAGSVNKVILIGNLGRDPEIRAMQNGGKIANLSIATSETWNDKASGERKERTEWHRVVVFNENIVRFIESYAKKGTKLYIEGQLETRKWTDQSGAEKYTTEIVLRPFRGELTMLDSARGGNSDGGYQSAPQQQAASSGGNNGGNWQPSAQDNFDDDIPF